MRRVPNTDFLQGMYHHGGSLDDERPGRKYVRSLSVRGLDGESSAGLAPLAAFEDLSELHLERVSFVDLSVLSALGLRTLEMFDARGVDLRPLEAFDELQVLRLGNFFDCTVPGRLRLPENLVSIGFVIDKRGVSGQPIRELIAAIEWSRLQALQGLNMGVGGLEPLAPIHADLGFIRELPSLRWLDIRDGVWHAGAEPSPVDPPFDGLPATLEGIRIDAWDPVAAERALRARLGRNVEISVSQREHAGDGHHSWALLAPEGGDESWTTYGSLLDVFEDAELVTEHEAMERATELLREADPGLLERLELDQESAGTGVKATNRSDLLTALRVLGIHPRE